MRELAGVCAFGQFQCCGGERTSDLREEQRAHGEVWHIWGRRLAEGPGGRTEVSLAGRQDILMLAPDSPPEEPGLHTAWLCPLALV